MSNVRIRAATLTDAEAVARVHVHAWRESYRGLVPDDLIAALSVERNTQQWQTIIGAGEASIALVVERVAEEAGRQGTATIVGFGAACDARSPELGTSGEVTAIYLLEAYKRRGIGRRLFTGLLQALAARGHRSACLWVLVDNHATRHFYEALGGRAGSQRIATDGPAPMHEIAYVWDDLKRFSGGLDE